MKQLWGSIVCLFLGHHYMPSYMYSHRGPLRRPWKETFQYECECCGEKTPIMNRKQHEQFIIDECPSWGGRGSDSQGYRSTTNT